MRTHELVEKAVKANIDAFLNKGFRIFAPENLTSYFYVVRGNDIAYVEYRLMSGLHYRSVHKPCKHAGTGFEAFSLEDAFNERPTWANLREFGDVQKYKDMDEFMSHPMNNIIKLVEIKSLP